MLQRWAFNSAITFDCILSIPSVFIAKPRPNVGLLHSRSFLKLLCSGGPLVQGSKTTASGGPGQVEIAPGVSRHRIEP